MKSSAFVVTALLSMVWLVGCGSETESGGGLPPADAPNGGTGEAMLDAAGEAPGIAAAAAASEEKANAAAPAEEAPAEEAPAEEAPAEEAPAEEAP
ncbi:MAG: hypothetical protein CMJ70_26885, partial [Planctomycetaceae bacterium]|nr:hypothetical protein [Planctomycetaceae bacterium]